MADNDILAGLPFQKLNPESTALLVIDMQKYFQAYFPSEKL